MKECVDRFFLSLADCSGCHLSSLCSPAINLAVNLRWLLSAFERSDSTFDHFLEMLIAKVFVFDSLLFETAISNVHGYFKKYDSFLGGGRNHPSIIVTASSSYLESPEVRHLLLPAKE